MSPTLLDVPPVAPSEARELDDWTELDVQFVEDGDEVDNLIYMTGDGCGRTCQSACTGSCRR